MRCNPAGGWTSPAGPHGTGWKAAQRAAFHPVLLFILLWCAACGSEPAGLRLQQEKGPFYIPPTPAPSTPPGSPGHAEQTAQANLAYPLPGLAATPDCSMGLVFIEDLTVPDGTLVSAGAEIDKRWRVENSGTCNWDERYRLKLISGPEMGIPSEQALYPALSGARPIIRLVFRAPSEPGSYRSAWQAYSPDGQPFGDTFYIDIVVQ